MTKHLTTIAFLFLLIPSLLAQNAEEANPDLQLDAEYIWPTDKAVLDKLEQWQDLKFGMLIHWGLYSKAGIVESWSICSEDEDWIPRDSNIRYDDYKRWYWNLNKEFVPTDFEPAQWAQSAKAAGMKYAIFTTKHHDGFAMYDTKFSDYSIAQGPAKAELDRQGRTDVAQYVFDAFRNEKMMVGAYFSKPDWHSQNYWWDRYATPDRHVNYKIENHPQRWNDFKNFVYNQIDEITSRYGAIDILWLDGGWVRPPKEDVDMDRIAARVRQNQPGILIVDRTVTGKYENYRTPERMIPDKQLPYPWETCMPLSKDWGYVPGATFKTASQVLNTLVEVVAKGGSLLLGIGPTPEGIIEPAVVDRLNEIGKWLECNGEAIYNTRPVKKYNDGNVWFTGSKDGGNLYAIITASEQSPMPKTISWKDDRFCNGQKLVFLANGKTLKCAVQKDGTVSVTLPKEYVGSTLPIAFKIK